MYGVLKESDNRKEVKAQRLATINSRTWTRRVQWLVSPGEPIKLKFWDGERYFETGVPEAFAQTVYDRFRNGASIEEAVSIFGCKVQPSRRTK